MSRLRQLRPWQLSRASLWALGIWCCSLLVAIPSCQQQRAAIQAVAAQSEALTQEASSRQQVQQEQQRLEAALPDWQALLQRDLHHSPPRAEWPARLNSLAREHGIRLISYRLEAEHPLLLEPPTEAPGLALHTSHLSLQLEAEALPPLATFLDTLPGAVVTSCQWTASEATLMAHCSLALLRLELPPELPEPLGSLPTPPPSSRTPAPAIGHLFARAPPETPPHIAGYVARSGGQRSVWIGGQVHNEQVAPP